MFDVRFVTVDFTRACISKFKCYDCRHKVLSPQGLIYMTFYSILYSLIQFFQKMKKWLDMTNSEDDFRKKIDRLNRNFAVVSVIFRKYDNIFFKIFKSPVAVESAKTHRSRKPR